MISWYRLLCKSFPIFSCSKLLSSICYSTLLVPIMDLQLSNIEFFSSLNSIFGSMVMTESGILLNNELADFADSNKDMPVWELLKHFFVRSLDSFLSSTMGQDRTSALCRACLQRLYSLRVAHAVSEYRSVCILRRFFLIFVDYCFPLCRGHQWIAHLSWCCPSARQLFAIWWHSWTGVESPSLLLRFEYLQFNL